MYDFVTETCLVIAIWASITAVILSIVYQGAP